MRTTSPDSNVFYTGQEDKRATKDSHYCGGSQYHSWPTPANVPVAYPSSDAKGYAAPPHYSVPTPHGYPPMAMHVPALPFGHAAAGQMVPTQPPMFGGAVSRTPRARTRPDTTDSSSSSCTPRDHYTPATATPAASPERLSPQKKHSRKHEGGHRFPVVKIPENLKKHGNPCPATWFNSRGYPLRMGKPDCKHYTSKGWCAYGTLCKFNHPDNNMASSPPMAYPMVPVCPPGSQPMVMNNPWMGVPYQWNGPWNQPCTSSPSMPAGYQPYVCHPCSAAGPCSAESANSAGSYIGRDHDKATDAESDGLYK